MSLLAGLWRVHRDQVGQPAILTPARVVDDARIPDAVKVATAGEPADLEVVPALVVVLADVQGHVEILDQVDEEPQGLTPLLDRAGSILEHHLQLPDLRDGEALPGLVPGEPVVVSGLIERDIDLMPGRRLGHPPADFVGPG